MIRCVIFACLEQDPKRSNEAQAACGYRVLQREHQLQRLHSGIEKQPCELVQLTGSEL